MKHETKTMHLFAGIGGGLLADLILGHTPIVTVEWESFQCQVLRERAKEGWFPELKVVEGDVQLFDASEYEGKIHCIHAGFPCQDLSMSGKKAGLEGGTRSSLYREVLRIAGQVRPRHIFFENVSAILHSGLERVLEDLASMGFDAEWCCLRASEVGAPHSRDRWWLLATDPTQVRSHEISKVQEEISFEGNFWESCEFNSILPCCPIWTDSERGDAHLGDGLPQWLGASESMGNAQVPLQAAVAYRLLGGM